MVSVEVLFDEEFEEREELVDRDELVLDAELEEDENTELEELARVCESNASFHAST